MDVRIVDFPATKVAAVEHHGAPELEHQTASRLIRWRVENRLAPDRHRNFGVHYTDPRTTPPEHHRVDFCVSVDDDVAPNPYGIVTKLLPACRCAVARHIGSRAFNSAAAYLFATWLPQSGEVLGEFPVFYHYVNVGPGVQEHEMITDVYLPLRAAPEAAPVAAPDPAT